MIISTNDYLVVETNLLFFNLLLKNLNYIAEAITNLFGGTL